MISQIQRFVLLEYICIDRQADRQIFTCETSEPQLPDVDVAQNSERVTRVVQLTAPDDAQVLQRNRGHGDVGYQHIALNLHYSLQRERLNCTIIIVTTINVTFICNFILLFLLMLVYIC